MIHLVPFITHYDALNWYGFEPQLDDNILTFSEGRIGTTDNPLRYTDDGIDGGWYLEEQNIELLPTDARIDVMLDTNEDEIFLLVRSDSLLETYPQRYELIVRLAWKDHDDWFVVFPRRSLP